MNPSNTPYQHTSGQVFWQLLIVALLLTIISLFMQGCGTEPDILHQNTIELYGYIGNLEEHADPVVFVTDSADYFIYEYDYDPRLVRVKRTVLVYSDNDRLIFIAERFD